MSRQIIPNTSNSLYIGENSGINMEKIPNLTIYSLKGMIYMYLGKLYFTKGINDLIENKIISEQEVMQCVFKHQRGDYGLTCEEDIQVNERNLNRNYGTVMSEYVLGGRRIWIITSIGDAETTYTTVLRPEEY